MRKLLFLILLLFLPAIVYGQQTIFVPVCTGDATDDTTEFNLIKTAGGSTNTATIKLPYKSDPTKRCKVNTLTLTSNITLDNVDGSGIAIVTGQTLTVVGPVISPPRLLWVNATNAFSNTNTIAGITTPTGGVAAAGGFSISPRLIASCGVPAITATQGTDSTPVNTETYIVEVFIPANTTVTGVALLNGSAVAGNVKISLATSAGVPISGAVRASTAQAGTAVYQLIPFAVAYAAKGPATYYILIQFNTNTTPRYRTHAVGVCGAAKKTGET